MFYYTSNIVQIFVWSLFWFSVACCWAMAEIELEGKFGWAEKAQTWYRSARHHPNNFFLRVVMTGKPLTGYHFPVFVLAIFISHLWLLSQWRWSVTDELITISLFLTWAPLWDNLWIIFNPNYKVGELGPGKLWWYQKSKWFFNLFPLENVIQWTAAVVISLIVSIYFQLPSVIINQVLFMLFLSVFSLISFFTFRPLYEKYYWQMREHDDRKFSGIFHDK